MTRVLLIVGLVSLAWWALAAWLIRECLRWQP